MKKDKIVIIRVNEELHKKLKIESATISISISKLVESLILEYFENQESKSAIL